MNAWNWIGISLHEHENPPPPDPFEQVLVFGRILQILISSQCMKGPKVMRTHVIGGNNVNGVVLGENVNSIKSSRLSEIALL